MTFSEAKCKVIQSNKKEIQKGSLKIHRGRYQSDRGRGWRGQEDKRPEKQIHKAAHSFAQGSPSSTACGPDGGWPGGLKGNSGKKNATVQRYHKGEHTICAGLCLHPPSNIYSSSSHLVSKATSGPPHKVTKRKKPCGRLTSQLVPKAFTSQKLGCILPEDCIFPPRAPQPVSLNHRRLYLNALPSLSNLIRMAQRTPKTINISYLGSMS